MQLIPLTLPSLSFFEKKWLPAVLLILLLSGGLAAQERSVVSQVMPGGNTVSELRDVPLQDVKPFLAYSLTWLDPDSRVWIRFSNGKKFTTSWLAITPDAHANPDAGRTIGQLGFTDKGQRAFQLRYEGEGPEPIEVHFFSPGPARATKEDRAKPATKTVTCPCPQPDYIARSGWCLPFDCPPNTNPENTTVTHLIVHHSAGTNVSNNWAAVVRAIWDFHVNANGWADIGYNWLVDPNGEIYEGRGDDVLGAHFCGQNTNTMGVCVLGDFTDIEPSPEALTALEELLAWKSCDIGADPLGFTFHPPSASTLPNISGHRDGCATQCPGNSFYPLLPVVRQDVADHVNTSCSGLPGPTALSAELVGEASVSLTWTDNSDTETGFELERSQGADDNFSPLAALPDNTTEYLDEGLAPNTTYFYRVRALTDAETSGYSNIEEVNTMVSATRESFSLQGARLVPNPAEEQVQLLLENELRGNFTAELHTLEGKQLRTWSFQKEGNEYQENLSLSGLPAGVYLLRLRHATGMATLRLLRR